MHEGFLRDTGMYFTGSRGQKSLGTVHSKLFIEGFLCSYVGMFYYAVNCVCIVPLANRLKRNLLTF